MCTFVALNVYLHVRLVMDINTPVPVWWRAASTHTFTQVLWATSWLAVQDGCCLPLLLGIWPRG